MFSLHQRRNKNIKFEMVACPGCGAKVQLTSKVLDDIGEKVQPTIPRHTVPGKNKRSPLGTPCSGSDTPIGEVRTKTILRTSKANAA